MNAQQREELIAAAIAARERAYAPYSRFAVGAAVLTADGTISAGCNVENASYGLTLCAERVAISTAVAAGRRELAGMAIATFGGHPPCGACRQFAAEFAADLPILLVNVGPPAAVSETTLAALLPQRFVPHFPHR